MKIDTVRLKVSHDTKLVAQQVLESLGLSLSEAFNLMLIQVIMRQGLPFQVIRPNIPNAETVKALEETDKGKGFIKCKDVDDLFK